ncbi:MAG: 16S rRNA (adenine(1518)-N(6)/adenine(1519)-N(6))-dimethyltransferase RsmA [Lachnospiraceae bacterium]|nr:16S rRNA (adenine(1518)-N(6)/adenine(1519)-N(6))-dimethyltransferase RsmA [Lachnospiraceae bacterium]
MSELSNFKNTQEIIKKHNFSIQKKYGQNFLIDEHVLNKIIAAAELTEDDYVIEIGPGIGTMTERMAPECRHVTAIEIDKELIPILSETLSGFDNVDIINEDVLKVDLNKLIAERNDNKPVKVVANLPYYITTPIIMSLLENKIPIDTITVMVQKEVADRMMVGPGTKDYGALSLAVQYYAKPYIVANVPMNCFIPRPNVASAVIRLTCHKEPPVTVKDEKLMFNLIRASFNQRRKTLINGISNFSGLSFTKEQVAMALNSIGLSENIRGESLDLEKFAKLSDALLET